MNKVQLGRFAPRGPDGRFVSPSSMSRWQQAMAARSVKNWIARSGQAASRANWMKAATVSKWVGRVAMPLGFVTGGYDQWSRGQGRTDLDGYQRGARIAVRSATSGLGGMGGAWAGAAGGAAVGTMIFPGVGTVIGGAIGGIAGGIAGGAAGSWAADHLVDPVAELTEGAGEAIEEAGDKIGEVASKLKFW